MSVTHEAVSIRKSSAGRCGQSVRGVCALEGGEALERNDEVLNQGSEKAVEESWSRDFMKCKAWRNERTPV